MTTSTAHNLAHPLLIGFGEYLQRFHAQIVADTPAVSEFAGREFSRAAAWAPGRMIDQVESMIGEWRKNDTSGTARGTPMLPVLLCAAARDFTPVMPDYSAQQADPTWVVLPNDPKERLFQLQALVVERRIQVCIIAADQPTCMSLAMQLALYVRRSEGDRVPVRYNLAGMVETWVAQIAERNLMPSIMSPEQMDNLTVIACDFTLRAPVPILRHPGLSAEDADGLGTHDLSDPSGFAGLRRITGYASPDPQEASPPQVFVVNADGAP